MKRWACISFAAVCVVFAAAPARANVSSVSIAPPNQTVSGTCPVTVQFTGTITGTPGSVSYQFFGNGGAPNGPTKTATIPNSGTVMVSDSEQVDAAHQGTWTRQLLAQQGNLMYSGKASYKATCGGGAPSPAPSIRPTIIPIVLGPPAPTNLTNTTDPKVCGQHIFPLVCIAMSSGTLTLVWNWSPGLGYTTLDGYNVYRVDNGMSKRVAHSTAGEGATGTLLQPISGGFNGTCYVARAYKGSSESGNSNTFCVSGGGVIAPAVLSSTQWGWRYRDHVYTLGKLGTWGFMCEDVCMGYRNDYESTLGVDTFQEGTYWRGYLQFDQGQISQLNNRITKATLSVPILSGDSSCFGGLGPANAQWIGNQDFVDGDFGYSISSSFSGGNATFDVTRVVKDWAGGVMTNYGFVFKGPVEDDTAHNSNSCMLDLSTSGTLTIQHF